MNDLERRLRHALVVYRGGNHPPVSGDQLAEAIRARISCHAFSVHPFHPEDFLVVLASDELKRWVTAGPLLSCHGTELFFRPWTRLAQATKVTMRTKAHLVLEGIPAHAWDREIAEDLVGIACTIEDVAPESTSRSDLSLFRMSVWTDDPDMIPPARTLVIPEPERELAAADRRTRSARETLRYPVLIHIDRIKEEIGPEEGWFDRTAIGSGKSGIPDSGDGDRLRMMMSMPWRRGTRDPRGGARPRGKTSQRRLYSQVVTLSLDWHLPPMERRMRSHVASQSNRAASDLLRSGRQDSSGTKVWVPKLKPQLVVSEPAANQEPSVQILRRDNSGLPVLEKVLAPEGPDPNVVVGLVEDVAGQLGGATPEEDLQQDQPLLPPTINDWTVEGEASHLSRALSSSMEALPPQRFDSYFEVSLFGCEDPRPDLEQD
jgi:hypothetical protein